MFFVADGRGGHAAGEARLAATHELELTRVKFQTELDALQAQLQSKEETLQDRESALAALEGQLQSQSEDRTRERRENKELLERRQQQLEDFQSQTTALLERIADHTTNIAEDVVFLVEGESIRHQHLG